MGIQNRHTNNHKYNIPVCTAFFMKTPWGLWSVSRGASCIIGAERTLGVRVMFFGTSGIGLLKLVARVMFFSSGLLKPNRAAGTSQIPQPRYPMRHTVEPEYYGTSNLPVARSP